MMKPSDESPSAPRAAGPEKLRPLQLPFGRTGGSVRTPMVIYDGECGFCRWSAATIARLDQAGNLAIAPAQDPQPAAIVERFGEIGGAGSIRLFDGSMLHSGAAALLEIAGQISCLRHIAVIVEFVGLGPVLDAAYRGFAPRRGRAAGLLSRSEITRRL